jgi:hypothetical protein
MKTAVLDTSIEAYREMPARQLGAQQTRIFEVIEDALRSGHADMSLQEIKAAYQAKFRTLIDLSTVSGRVNELVGVRLERLETTRHCSVTGKTIHPVRIPQTLQRVLFQ